MLKLSQKISSRVIQDKLSLSKKYASNVCIVDNPYTQEVK